MKILVINPPALKTVKEYPDERGSGFLEASDYGIFPPLGPLYVLSYAERMFPEHDYHFLDCVGESLSYKQLYHRLVYISPDIVGITSFTPSLRDVIETARIVRDIVPHAHICLGGHHAIAFPHESCLLPHFDSVIVGEGERAFAALINAVVRNLEYKDIEGIYTRSAIKNSIPPHEANNNLLKSVSISPAHIEDIDALPIPNRDLISHINYNSIIGQKKRLATIITSRGCPYKCSFCDVPYKHYRQRSMELVMDEIETCLAQGYEEFHFYDDLFNITDARVIGFCDALARRNLNIVWDFRGRINGVTWKMLERCKSSGLRMISFGVETGSDTGLQLLKKGTDIEQIKRVFQWCRDLDIMTVADFMIGLPNETTAKEVHDNIDFLISLDPDYAQINILNLYPNTAIYQAAVDKGIIAKGHWTSFASNPTRDFRIGHWTQWLSEKELVRLHRQAYRRFYFRPSYIYRRLRKLRTLHELKSGIKGVLKLLRIFKIW